MTIPIQVMPPAPTRQDPVNFDSRGDAVMGRLPSLVDDFNEAIVLVNGAVVATALSETNASTHKDAAAASAAAAAASLSAVSAAVGLTVVPVTGTTQAATAGNMYVLQNAALSTVTLPASPVAGNVVCVLPANGRIDNVIARNGKQINGLAEDMTIDNASASVLLRYIDATSQWRIV